MSVSGQCASSSSIRRAYLSAYRQAGQVISWHSGIHWQGSWISVGLSNQWLVTSLHILQKWSGIPLAQLHRHSGYTPFCWSAGFTEVMSICQRPSTIRFGSRMTVPKRLMVVLESESRTACNHSIRVLTFTTAYASIVLPPEHTCSIVYIHSRVYKRFVSLRYPVGFRAVLHQVRRWHQVRRADWRQFAPRLKKPRPPSSTYLASIGPTRPSSPTHLALIRLERGAVTTIQ